ncbi:MAG: TAXI family TRAP transporter solute-binding subunit [Acidobacteria bacterium]|nr:TAXI family TRAP transporter solute-binding subunit [Acidobacteriota bacterium]
MPSGFSTSSRLLSAGSVSLAMLITSSCAAPTRPEPRETLTVLLSPQVNDDVPPMLAQALRDAVPRLDVDVRAGISSVQSVKAVQDAEADVAIAGADSVYVAFVGQLDGQRAPFDKLRGIAVLQPRLFELLVRKDSPITRIEDLGGRKVAYTEPGTQGSPTFQLVLDSFGFRDGDVDLVELNVKDKLAQLINGDVDAAFFYGSHPIDEVTAATRAGARLLPLTGSAIEHLRQNYPFLRPFDIPDGTEANRNIRTVGLNVILICRSDLDESLVHEVTRSFFAALTSLSTLEESFRHINLEQASATPIPLHPGAARFYRERELAR